MNKRSVRLAFDRAAATYDAAAWLQQEVAERLDARLDYMKLSPATVLDAGCGTGHGLNRLAQRYPQAYRVGLDLAYAMLMQARHRALLPAGKPGWLERLATRFTAGGTGCAGSALLCADLERLPLAPASLDLVWSNLAMQWLPDLAATLRQIRAALRPQGLLVFSTFGPDTLKELKAAFSGLDGYGHVNRFLDMHDIGDMLMHAGYADPVMEMEYLTLTYADLKDLLRELKAIGAKTVATDRRSGLMGRATWGRLSERYEAFRREGRLPATYEIIYGHAWVGSGPLPAAEAVVKWVPRPSAGRSST